MQTIARGFRFAACLCALAACSSSDDDDDGPAAGSGGTGDRAGQTGSGGGEAGGGGRSDASGGAGASGRAGSGGAGTGAGGAAAGASGSPAGSGAGGAAGATTSGAKAGASLIVAVGSFGFRARSSEGGAFAICRNPSGANDHTPDLLRDVGYGDGVFIAVGGDANAMVMRSLDGEHWQEDLHPKQGCQDPQYPSSCDNWMGAVAYHDGVWLAGGGNGALMRSTDQGQTWQGVHPSAAPGPMRHMAAGSGRFVVGSDKGAVFVSADKGDTWTKFDLWNKPSSEGMRIAHGAGSFIAWGSFWNGGGFDQGCFVSTDKGDHWQACAAAVANSASFVHDGTRWLAPAAGGYASSDDGVSWTMHNASNFPSELLFDGKTLYGRTGSKLLRGSSPDAMQAISGVEAPEPRSWTIGIVYDSNVPVTGVPACTDRG